MNLRPCVAGPGEEGGALRRGVAGYVVRAVANDELPRAIRRERGLRERRSSSQVNRTPAASRSTLCSKSRQ